MRKLFNVIAINTNKVTGVKPKSFKDLLKSEYKNLLVMPNPLFSGAALSTVGTLVNKNTWGYFEALRANGMRIEQSNPITITKLINGEYGVGILTDFNLRAEKAKGASLEIVYPTEGAILVPYAGWNLEKQQELSLSAAVSAISLQPRIANPVRQAKLHPSCDWHRPPGRCAIEVQRNLERRFVHCHEPCGDR